MKLLKVLGCSVHVVGAGIGLTGLYVLFSGDILVGTFSLMTWGLCAAMAEGVMS